MNVLILKGDETGMVNIRELRHKPVSEIVKVLNVDNLISIDLVAVAYMLNISILSYSFNQYVHNGEKIICAFVTNNKGKSCIFYDVELADNKDDGLRIEIAKTFARYILTGEKTFYITKSTEFSAREDLLVNEMLMPEAKVKDTIKELILPTTFSLAKIFSVSPEFVNQRLDKMDISLSLTLARKIRMMRMMSEL